jgi:hypothetical protein
MLEIYVLVGFMQVTPAIAGRHDRMRSRGKPPVRLRRSDDADVA